MPHPNEPLVTVLTPVYNGEKYLSECIESVLSQSYSNWEYIIINNCSSDKTLEIANRYAAADDRITIYDNNEFADVITNHNVAFDKISTKSKYCKIVQADDWLYPQCLEKMIEHALQHPSIGIISAYSISDTRIHNQGLPYKKSVLTGAEIASSTLRGEYYLFRSPTSLLIESKYIRENMPYYKGLKLNADIDALYNIFLQRDFGFIHQILTFVRSHDESMTSKDDAKGRARLLSHYDLFLKHGPKYLLNEEFSTHKNIMLDSYYNKLAYAVFELSDRNFWKTQINEQSNLGLKFNYFRLITSCLKCIFNNPIKVFRKLFKSLLKI